MYLLAFPTSEPEFVFWLIFTCWGLLELWLILRDKGKVNTSQDRGTINFLTMTIFIGIAGAFFLAAVTNLPITKNPLFSLRIGTIIMSAGLLLRLWAIYILGKYFRRVVMVQKNHKVITSGPFTYVRHPSYAGILLVLCGIGISMNNLISLLFIIIIPLTGLMKRINVEEEMLTASLGDEYKRYQRRTKRLIPFIY